MKRAVETVVRTWQTDSATEYRTISGDIAGVLKRLAKRHGYETRWDKKDRLEAEAKAAAEAESPQG